MGKNEQETACNGQPEHEFNRVLGASNVPGPDEEKEVIFGCSRCDAEETRKGKHIF